GKLTVRVYGAPLISKVEDQAQLGIGHAFGGPFLRIGALQMFADGSLGSRPFRDHGVKLSFGTDWAVAPLDPMLTLYAAVTRATLDGKNPQGWFPEQKLSIQEAIATYTMGSAYAE